MHKAPALWSSKNHQESNITEYDHRYSSLNTHLHLSSLTFPHLHSLLIYGFMALSFHHVPQSSIQLLGTKSSMDRFTRSRSSSSLNCAASSKASRNVVWSVWFLFNTWFANASTHIKTSQKKNFTLTVRVCTPCHALIEVPSTWALQIEFPSFRGALFFLKTSLKSDLVLSNGNFGYPVSILKFGWCILNVTGIHVMLYKKHWRPAGWPSPSLLSG